MTTAVTYTSRFYDANAVRRRYVRQENDVVYHWCEVGEDRYFDLRQGTAGADDIPANIRAEAGKRRGYYPSYVEWPISAIKED